MTNAECGMRNGVSEGGLRTEDGGRQTAPTLTLPRFRGRGGRGKIRNPETGHRWSYRSQKVLDWEMKIRNPQSAFRNQP